MTATSSTQRKRPAWSCPSRVGRGRARRALRGEAGVRHVRLTSLLIKFASGSYDSSVVPTRGSLDPSIHPGTHALLGWSRGRRCRHVAQPDALLPRAPMGHPRRRLAPPRAWRFFSSIFFRLRLAIPRRGERGMD
jgi:hypothetical protein